MSAVALVCIVYWAVRKIGFNKSQYCSPLLVEDARQRRLNQSLLLASDTVPPSSCRGTSFTGTSVTLPPPLPPTPSIINNNNDIFRLIIKKKQFTTISWINVIYLIFLTFHSFNYSLHSLFSPSFHAYIWCSHPHLPLPSHAPFPFRMILSCTANCSAWLLFSFFPFLTFPVSLLSPFTSLCPPPPHFPVHQHKLLWFCLHFSSILFFDHLLYTSPSLLALPSHFPKPLSLPPFLSSTSASCYGSAPLLTTRDLRERHEVTNIKSCNISFKLGGVAVQRVDS